MMNPEVISGHKVTGRGVHLHPTGFHSWVDNADHWTGIMRSCSISWALTLSDSDGAVIGHKSVGGLSAVQVLLEAGIIPVVRFLPSNLPRPFEQQDHVVTLVEQCEPYGVIPIVQWPNEPGDPREWIRDVPDDWWDIFIGEWQNFARLVIERGAIAGFPDGPCYDQDPFPPIESTWKWWEDGKCVYLGHHYALNRPVDYPYDPIQREGLQWTEADLQEAMGDFYHNPDYNDVPLEAMNRARIEQMDPCLTAVQDDTCWRGWEKIQYWMELNFGKVLSMAMTEGGQTPGARAGGGSSAEIRYPKPAPENVAQFTLDMFTEDTPMLFQTPWLLADGDMAGGDQGWPYDAWSTWAFEQYGRLKPVVKMLQDNPPNGSGPTAEQKIREAKQHIDSADDSLDKALSLL